jgi:hypothetical protein
MLIKRPMEAHGHVEFMDFFFQIAKEKNAELNSSKSKQMEDDCKEFKELSKKLYEEKYADIIKHIAEEESKKHTSTACLITSSGPTIEEISDEDLLKLCEEGK